MAAKPTRVRIKKHRGKYLAYYRSRKPGQKYEYTTFEKRKDAETFKAETEQGFKDGTFIPNSASCSIEQAAKLWLDSPDIQGLERSTSETYEQHLDNHIKPFFGGTLLTDIDGPMVTEFEEWLQKEAHGPRNRPASQAMARKVMVTFRSMLGYMHRRGFVGRNIAREFMKPSRSPNGGRRKLEVGRDIPTLDEIRAIIENAKGRWRPFLLTAIFTGLRASELRGLRWKDLELSAKLLHVRQRADKFKRIGPPKSGAGTRSVPLPPIVVNSLREWRLQCPQCDEATLERAGDHLAFPSRDGRIESHTVVLRDGFGSVQLAAGVVVDTGRKDKRGQSILEPKYGLHALRHWFASWCLNRIEDGGLGLSAKAAQKRLGHSSIRMTLDVYGHLFPASDEAEALVERL